MERRKVLYIGIINPWTNYCDKRSLQYLEARLCAALLYDSKIRFARRLDGVNLLLVNHCDTAA